MRLFSFTNHDICQTGTTKTHPAAALNISTHDSTTADIKAKTPTTESRQMISHFPTRPTLSIKYDIVAISNIAIYVKYTDNQP